MSGPDGPHAVGAGTGCVVCGLDQDANKILLCDGCDAEYHIYCLVPPLHEIPEGDFYCKRCVQQGRRRPPATTARATESNAPSIVSASSSSAFSHTTADPAARFSAASAPGGMPQLSAVMSGFAVQDEVGRLVPVRLEDVRESKFRGVLKLLSKGLKRPFVARIVNDKSVFQIGLFASEIEAAHAYDKTAIQLSGRHAELNFPHLHEGFVAKASAGLTPPAPSQPPSTSQPVRQASTPLRPAPPATAAAPGSAPASSTTGRGRGRGRGRGGGAAGGRGASGAAKRRLGGDPASSSDSGGPKRRKGPAATTSSVSASSAPTPSVNGVSAGPYRGVVVVRGVPQAQIMVQGKLVQLGASPTVEEAALAYDKAALKYFGGAAADADVELNFPERRTELLKQLIEENMHQKARQVGVVNGSSQEAGASGSHGASAGSQLSVGARSMQSAKHNLAVKKLESWTLRLQRAVKLMEAAHRVRWQGVPIKQEAEVEADADAEGQAESGAEGPATLWFAEATATISDEMTRRHRRLRHGAVQIDHAVRLVMEELRLYAEQTPADPAHHSPPRSQVVLDLLATSRFLKLCATINELAHLELKQVDGDGEDENDDGGENSSSFETTLQQAVDLRTRLQMAVVAEKQKLQALLEADADAQRSALMANSESTDESYAAELAKQVSTLLREAKYVKRQVQRSRTIVKTRMVPPRPVGTEKSEAPSDAMDSAAVDARETKTDDVTTSVAEPQDTQPESDAAEPVSAEGPTVEKHVASETNDPVGSAPESEEMVSESYEETVVEEDWELCLAVEWRAGEWRLLPLGLDDSHSFSSDWLSSETFTDDAVAAMQVTEDEVCNWSSWPSAKSDSREESLATTTTPWLSHLTALHAGEAALREQIAGTSDRRRRLEGVIQLERERLREVVGVYRRVLEDVTRKTATAQQQQARATLDQRLLSSCREAVAPVVKQLVDRCDAVVVARLGQLDARLVDFRDEFAYYADALLHLKGDAAESTALKHESDKDSDAPVAASSAGLRQAYSAFYLQELEALWRERCATTEGLHTALRSLVLQDEQATAKRGSCDPEEPESEAETLVARVRASLAQWQAFEWPAGLAKTSIVRGMESSPFTLKSEADTASLGQTVDAISELKQVIIDLTQDTQGSLTTPSSTRASPLPAAARAEMASSLPSLESLSASTLVVYHPVFMEHQTPKSHPECPERLNRIVTMLTSIRKKHDRSLKIDRLTLTPDELAPSESTLLAVHSAAYLQQLRDRSAEATSSSTGAMQTAASSKTGSMSSTAPSKSLVFESNSSISRSVSTAAEQPTEQSASKGIPMIGAFGAHSTAHQDVVMDTYVSGKSWDVARAAAGTVCLAVDRVARREFRHAVCLVRPPGHHVGRHGRTQDAPSSGFCLLNNVVIGAMHARQYPWLRRIAVLDWDIHHGNGTEELLREDSDAFFASIHLHAAGKFFPGTGPSCQREHVVNVALEDSGAGSGSLAFRHAMSDQVLPAMRAFRPDIVFISAGFDGHRDDILGGRAAVKDTSVPAGYLEEDYVWATQQVLQLAEECCDGRVVSVLEGGYDVRKETNSLAKSVAAHISAIATFAPQADGEESPESRAVVKNEGDIRARGALLELLSKTVDLGDDLDDGMSDDSDADSGDGARGDRTEAAVDEADEDEDMTGGEDDDDDDGEEDVDEMEGDGVEVEEDEDVEEEEEEEQEEEEDAEEDAPEEISEEQQGRRDDGDVLMATDEESEKPETELAGDASVNDDDDDDDDGDNEQSAEDDDSEQRHASVLEFAASLEVDNDSTDDQVERGDEDESMGDDGPMARPPTSHQEENGSAIYEASSDAHEVWNAREDGNESGDGALLDELPSMQE
ncbi:hypothetical protein ATCC90586_004768 [Pythium insidiosum]|nr:hypothetical protein ATCC90586_004768 [Pythium insidiosum]